MDIRIEHLIDGARRARGLAVVIDVFRAFTVECCLFDGGVSQLLAVGSKELAYSLREQHPDWLLIGERHGKMLEGFNYGNSPSQLAGAPLRGKTAVHTTSAGTQGLVNALGADEVLTGSLVNAAAIARYIKRSGANVVSLVCMGLEAKTVTDEDTLCAEYIRSLLRDEAEFPLLERANALRYTAGAKFFDPAYTGIYPTEDFYLCIQPDKYDFVIRMAEYTDGICHMRAVGPD